MPNRNGASACLSRNYNVVVLMEASISALDSSARAEREKVAAIRRRIRGCQPRIRMRPSWATVATRVPSSVNTRARASPRAPEADGDHWS